jgi:transposase
MVGLADLPDDMDALKAMIVVMADRNDRLERLLVAFKQALFGRKSEKLDPDQFELALEDIETGISAIEAEKEAHPAGPAAPKRPRAANRGSLPKHLPRIEVVIEPETTTCGCGADLHVIGEDVSERLDVIPAQFRVIVTRRPRYGCRACETGVVQAPAPARLIPGGMPTEATIAHVLVAKYADHLPLYRQAQIFCNRPV